MFDIAHHQIRPVHHAPIPDLNCCLWMASSGLVTDLDPVVILVKGICIIGILGFRVRKHPDEFAIVISEVPFCPSDSRCYNLVKLAIPSDQELHIFFFCDELPYQLSDLFFSFKEAVNLTVAEERHGIDIEQELSPVSYEKCSVTIAFSCAAISEKSRFKSSVFTLILLPLIW